MVTGEIRAEWKKKINILKNSQIYKKWTQKAMNTFKNG